MPKKHLILYKTLENQKSHYLHMLRNDDDNDRYITASIIINK